VKTIAPIARVCREAHILVHPALDDSAATSLDQEGLAYTTYRPGGAPPHADVALLNADWNPQHRDIVKRCRRAEIPTLVLQEAVNVDFDGPLRRMRWADAVAITGAQTVRYLARDVMFLTGNPRFDAPGPASAPDSDRVLINCNFMLGFGGEWGGKWLDLAVEAVRESGRDYVITRHPRDDTDLSGVENVLDSGAYRVRDQLAACGVLVSRDSSLPYEALLSNRPVIYFDPFGEKERTLREDSTGLILKCATKDELVAALRTITTSPPPHAMPDAEIAFASLFTSVDGASHRRVLAALNAMASNPEAYRTRDACCETGPASAIRDTIDLRIRPRLRRIPFLRVAWRAVRHRKR
jgi:hypothetical protein